MRLKDAQKYLSPFMILFLALIFFFPILFQNKTFYAFDCLFEYLPWSSPDRPDYRSHNTLITDPINVFYASHYVFQQNIREGRLPLWNGLSFCGTPFVGYSSFVPYSSPLVFIFFHLLPLTSAHDLLLLIHLIGAGVFTFLFLRRILLDNLSSVFGAIAWMFSGYVMVWFEFEHVPFMAMTLPGTLYLIELFLRDRSIFKCSLLAGMLSLSICESFGQLIIYQMFFVSLYFIFRLFSETAEWKQRFCKTGAYLSVVLISMVVSSYFFSVHYMMFKGSQRQPISYSDLFKTTGQLPVKYLSTMIFPDLFGNPATELCFTPRKEFSQPYNNYNELCIYSGILTVFLIPVCFLYFRNNKIIPFFIISAVFTLLSAMGTMIYYPMAKLIPGLSFSTPVRILYIFAFCMAMLAAFGLDILIKNKIQKKILLPIWAAIIVTAVLISLFVRTDDGILWTTNYYLSAWDNWKEIKTAVEQYYSFPSVIIDKPLLLILVSFLICTGMICSLKEKQKKIFVLLGIMLLSCDLISFGRLYNTASPKEMTYPVTPGIQYLMKDPSIFRVMTLGEEFFQNSFVPFGIDDIGGYASLFSRRYGEYIHLSQNGLQVPPPDQISRWILFYNIGDPLLDIINTKYIAASPSAVIHSPHFKTVYQGEVSIYENLNVFPRIFFTPGYQLAKNQQDAYKLLGSFKRNDFIDYVILEDQPPENFQDCSEITENAANNASIRLISYTSNQIELEIAAEKKGFLVMSDAYHPDWQLQIDGQKSEILRANYIMRAIPVTPGKHHIIMTFRPKLLLAGMAVSFLGWIFILCVIGVFGFREIQRNSKSSDRN